ncbi:MAG: hypothetical protein NC094_01390 [Bacteroidales bacterium]|nr:hypothetical protein [Lachnoclostridium sp.]MCM1384504.1 hypothetical protein [Lachnoclostridium sp.]MCM1464048.1 hypothetical protein [Bacteroidales bacterium]
MKEKRPEGLAMEMLRNERRKEKILATGLLISVTANIVMAVVIFFLKKH